MAYQWGRFTWWLYHDPNAPGVMQTYTATITVILTAVLIGVTAWYAKLTRTMTMLTQQMAGSMRDQLDSSFQPHVEVAFIGHTHGIGTSYGKKVEDVSGVLCIRNRGDIMIKLVAVGLSVDFKDPRFARKTATLDEASNRLIAPDKDATFKFCLYVDEGASTSEYNRSAIVHLSDLAGFSKHSFCISDFESSTIHYLNFV